MEDEAKSRITVSRQFKDKVVKPILKVTMKIEENSLENSVHLETFSS